jgi:hypothetical protein
MRTVQYSRTFPDWFRNFSGIMKTESLCRVERIQQPNFGKTAVSTEAQRLLSEALTDVIK